uniref:Uncharacterized protein n=1 Tax=Arion vulgaris TaxID=1028688 RepID=A0A0B7AFL2_9EUPU
MADLKSGDGSIDRKEDKAKSEAKVKAEELEEAKKAEEVLLQKVKEARAKVPRMAPHNIPNWDLEQVKETCMWHVRISPIDQEDCRNCILDTATKTAHKALYYVPKRKSGHGIAELFIKNSNDAIAVMGRIVRTAFYHRYVTIELTRRGQLGTNVYSPYKKIEETAIVVLDATRCVKLRNNAISNEGQKSLWVRYLPEKTSPDFLRVLFPLSQSAQVQTHDGLQIGLVEANSKPDLQVFLKSYLTVTINGKNVLSLYNKEPTEKESEIKTELEKAVLAFGELKQVPTEMADKQNQRREDKSETARIMKRTMNQQHVGDQPASKRGRNDPPVQRGGSGNWGGSHFGQGASVGFAAAISPRTVTAEMMMMQARLNQTIRTQLLLLNPSTRRGFNTGFAGRFSTASRGGFGGW